MTVSFLDKNAVEKVPLMQKEFVANQKDAEELERRAQETAVNLVKADQQLQVGRLGSATDTPSEMNGKFDSKRMVIALG